MDDFGFDEQNQENLKSKYDQIQELIFPLIDNLIATSDKANIYWPNRKDSLIELKKNLIKIMEM